MEDRQQRHALAILCLLLMPLNLLAQPVTGNQSGSGVSVGFAGLLVPAGEWGIGIHTTYSIAGVLDIGGRYSLAVDTAASESTNRVGFSYSVALARQSHGAPLSARLYGSYFHTARTSDFLTHNRLVSEGQGYSVSLDLIGGLPITPSVTLLLGGLTEYTTAHTITEATFVYDPDNPPFGATVDYGEYPLSETETTIVFGPYVAISVDFGDSWGMIVGTSVVFDSDFTLKIRPALHFLFREW
jgi:hypothetical protein